VKEKPRPSIPIELAAGDRSSVLKGTRVEPDTVYVDLSDA
jgi:hypothetical protein